MIIKCLMENTTLNNDFNIEHGLSLYIETISHKILFDLGQTDKYIDNAKLLNINLEDIDIVVISHGHYDHGGGLESFLIINQKAKIHIHKNAFDDFYSKSKDANTKRYIGLNKALKNNERMVFCEDNFLIDDELEIFSNIKGVKLLPSGNDDLLMKKENDFYADDFKHEQNLIIKEKSKILLVTGCSHKGIINIIDEYNLRYKSKIDTVIGGFHLYNPSKKSESLEKIKEIGLYLKESETQYYTCHCTGKEPYDELKKIMKEQIQYLATGYIITI